MEIKPEEFYEIDQLLKIFLMDQEFGRNKITKWINSSPNREIRDQRKSIMFSFMYGGEQ